MKIAPVFNLPSQQEFSSVLQTVKQDNVLALSAAHQIAHGRQSAIKRGVAANDEFVTVFVVPKRSALASTSVRAYGHFHAGALLAVILDARSIETPYSLCVIGS